MVRMTTRISSRPLSKARSQIGLRAAASRAPTEEMRETIAPASQVAQQARPTGQASASMMPRKVATPLPP